MSFSPAKRSQKRPKFTSVTGSSTPLFIIVAIIAIAIGLYVQTGQQKKPNHPELAKAILLPVPKDLGEVSFVDHNSESFGLSNLQGKWSILFFGFTNCPDICPSTMQTLKLVKQRVELEDAWQHYQVVMVSVDPERDSVERLKNYVPFFDPEFIGVRAEVEHTAAFAKNLGILFFKREPASNGGYDVDHGASLILVNPDGKYAGVISAPHKVDQISADLISLAAFENGSRKSVKNPEIRSSEKIGLSARASARPTSAISFSDAWIRPAPPTATSMAAYFEVTNHSDADIIIVDSHSPAFGMTMVHETVIKNDVASMHHLDSLVIPAGSTVSFAPMGTHMMLMQPQTPLSLGDTAELSLIDSKGNTYTETVTVKQTENP